MKRTLSSNPGLETLIFRRSGRWITVIITISLIFTACTPAAPLPTPTAPTVVPATEAAPPTSEQPAEPAKTPVMPPQFPNPNAFEWKVVLTGLDNPLDLASPGDNSERYFILEKAGTIRVAKGGALLPKPFLDLNGLVNTTANEQGLLGIAFHPQYASNGFFYLNYTDRDGNTVVSRWQVSPDPDTADPGSEKPLLRIQQPYPNHNGGGMSFGPDGTLYIATGDGGSSGDPQGHAQALDTLLGKILRLDVNSNERYAIPVSNPFASGGGSPEIWVNGLRNPWRFSFDRLTGDLYIADVGQNKVEEINFLPAGSPGGANFGWNYREGAHPFKGSPPANLELTDPVWEYDHSQGCSITGGYVYRGPSLPEWQGIYVFGDFCTGSVWGLLQTAPGIWEAELMYKTGAGISSFGEDDDGELYLLDYRDGQVLRLERK